MAHNLTLYSTTGAGVFSYCGCAWSLRYKDRVVKNAIAHQGGSTLNATLGREDEIVNVEIEIQYDRVVSEPLRLVPCQKSNGGVLKNAAVPTPELPAFVAEALRRASAQAGRPFVMLTYRSLSDLGNRERKSG